MDSDERIFNTRKDIFRFDSNKAERAFLSKDIKPLREIINNNSDMIYDDYTKTSDKTNRNRTELKNAIHFN